MTLWVKPNHANESVQTSQERKKARQVRLNVKVLLTVFFDCSGAPWILATTLKLYADCAKQLIRNAQNCRKTNHGFRVMIAHQRLRDAIRQKRTELWKNQSWFSSYHSAPAYTSMPQPAYSMVFALADFFLFPEAEVTDERKEFSNDWANKKNIGIGALDDTKKRVSEVFRGLETTLV